jgi:hypothetical protein
MLALDPKTAELHNLDVRDGRIAVRAGFASHATPQGSDVFVAGFTVENPRTTEPWHYLFEQNATTGVMTLRVYTEEFTQVFSMGLGTLAIDPVITWGVVNNQLFINSPSFSVPLYGVVGSGLIPALKTPTKTPELTALDLPSGHSCSWKNRWVIAAGNNLFINNGALDPRTFVSQNAISLPGEIYDVFEGPDGALYVFTSRDAYALPADALSQAQLSIGFIDTIPGVQTSRPRNAVACAGMILALGGDGLSIVTRTSQTRLDVTPYEGPRARSAAIEVQDYRVEGQLFATSNGALVSVAGASTPFVLNVDTRGAFRSYQWSRVANPLRVVGTLRTRDGATLYVTRARILESIGTVDPDGLAVEGVACVRMPGKANEARGLRFLTISTDTAGQTTRAFSAGVSSSLASPTLQRDAIIDIALWSASATQPYASRTARTVRHPFPGERQYDVLVEMSIDGALRTLGIGDVEYVGQAPQRRSRSQ